jgi:DNA sulfur modification protein DndD
MFNIELNVINEKIDSANRMLEAVPSEEKVRSILDQWKSKEKDLGHEKGRLEFLNSELKEIEIEQEKIQKIIRAKLDEISAELTKKHLDDRILNHAKRSRNTLETFKVKLLDTHLSRVSEEISNCFRLLHRKNKFLLKFEIDSSDYSLKIIKPDNSTITAKSLSAGERQLLAVSILWALAKCSGKKLPTVIDTPLGRLDGPHREKVVNNYFPKASDQVLIFSTDSEITNDHYHNLKKYISAEYSINYDEDTESSLITSGYFKHMVNA